MNTPAPRRNVKLPILAVVTIALAAVDVLWFFRTFRDLRDLHKDNAPILEV